MGRLFYPIFNPGDTILSYRLINQNDSSKTIRMNNWTWYGILGLAESYGWNPRGTATPSQFEMAGFFSGGDLPRPGSYWGKDTRLVLFEDALNLADALEEAFVKYEPVRLPSLHPFHLAGDNGGSHHHTPAVGVIQLMIRFCQSGAFLIEPL